MKNPFKTSKKKEKFPTLQVPRLRPEITQEFEKLATQAGSTQYLIVVKEQELKQLNQRLFELNNEAAAREKLDKEAAQAKPTEVTNVQT